MKPNAAQLRNQLMQMIVSKWISKPVYAAAELCLADILADGPKSIEEIAQESQTHAPTLYRLMRALASVGIFEETYEMVFDLTPMAALLKKDAMRSMVLMFNSDWSDKAWGCLVDSLKTGETAFVKAHGMPVSVWLKENPEAASVFNDANALKSAGMHCAIIDAYDFSDITKLADIGGGLGVLTAEILTANPHMKGIVADVPAVIKQTRQVISDRGLGTRCRAVTCDFFKKVPVGFDTYLLSNILHDWNDGQCRVILRNCHKVMFAKSRLLVVEMVIPSGNMPAVSKLLDLEMLVTTGGRERTETEYKDLFESAGFRLSRRFDTQDNVSILECVKI